MNEDKTPKVKVRFPLPIPIEELNALQLQHQKVLEEMTRHVNSFLPDLTATMSRTLALPRFDHLFTQMEAMNAAIQPTLNMLEAVREAVQPKVTAMNALFNSSHMKEAMEDMLSFGKIAQNIFVQNWVDPFSVTSPVTSEDTVREGEELQTEKVEVPSVFDNVQTELEAKLLPCLPETAELLDTSIAIDGTNCILFAVGDQWMPYRVGKQIILVINYVRNLAPHPHRRLVSLTELAQFSKGTSMRTKRSAIGTRLLELEKLSARHGCKPIIIKSGGKRCLNPELSYCKKFRWDQE
ncbi:hypothetical protein H6770_05715 [Candidatus Peribacteria bacterium]|nr:hypothetical protein [Candidatus Peribacteria bacterium]